jgi:hypothetical protein
VVSEGLRVTVARCGGGGGEAHTGRLHTCKYFT